MVPQYQNDKTRGTFGGKKTSGLGKDSLIQLGASGPDGGTEIIQIIKIIKGFCFKKKKYS